MTPKHELDLSAQTWSVRMVGRTPFAPSQFKDHTLPAKVPGCIHLDLIRAGVIEHPNIGFAERDQFWVGRADWEFECQFKAPPELLSSDRIELVCEGLDTIASLTLNGEPIGSTANMFHEHRFDIASAMRAGSNSLRIHFTSPLNHIESERDRIGARPVNGDWDPYIFIRKSACNFGWDWGPKVPTVGIWRPIRIEAWDNARIRSVRPLVIEANASRAMIRVAVDVESSPNQTTMSQITAALSERNGRTWTANTRQNENQCELTIEIDNPQLWWPTGHGDQPLYELTVSLGDPNAPVDHWHGRIGLRTVLLRTNTDEIGSEFTLEINGRRIFCKGSNWIPDTLFPTEMTADRYRERVGQARDANMNMLRVWGGGFYEDRAFYDACDEMGILVWQDFMFACAMYPEEDPYPILVEAEARANVTRLCAHPCVVLWCGGNENVWGYQHWGWKERLNPGQTWGEHYYTTLLPGVVAELDPTRPYLPNSPWSGSVDRSATDESHGDQHTWDEQFEEYRTLIPRFISEFGRQSPPSLRTLQAALAHEDLCIDSPAMHHRQRATGGNEKIYTSVLAEWFGDVTTFEQWHYLTNVLQCRAIRIGTEWARANQPRCMGVLTWQLNDCWAGHSWSAIDSEGQPKPLLNELRQAFQPVHGSIQPMQGHLAYVVSNESDQTRQWIAVARRIRFDGQVLAETQIHVDIPSGHTAVCCHLDEHLGNPVDPSFEFIDIGGECAAQWFYLRDLELRYPEPRFESSLEEHADGYRLTIFAETLIRDALVNAEHIGPDAVARPVLRTILPGESATWDIEGIDEISTDTLQKPPVFQCVNWFGRS